jgi:hypothetical protein
VECGWVDQVWRTIFLLEDQSRPGVLFEVEGVSFSPRIQSENECYTERGHYP